MRTFNRLALPCFLLAALASSAAWSTTELPAMPDGHWTWVDVDGASCANGSQTGFAVNPAPGARQLLLYLQGGGMCTDEASCWGPSPTAANLGGYNAASFASETFTQNEIFQRSGTRPFSKAVMAYVPYCTGDLHIGTATAELPTPTNFVGASNLEKYMAMLHAAYPQLEHIWIAGASAGGAGALLNHWFAAQAFGVRVDVIDDSAPPMAAPKIGVPAVWQVRTPPNCPACSQDLLTGYYAYSKAQLPASRFAFLDYAADSVLPTYFQMSPEEFQPAYLQTLKGLARDPNARLLLAYATSHVVLTAPQHNVRRSAMLWLSQMVKSREHWSSKPVVPR